MFVNAIKRAARSLRYCASAAAVTALLLCAYTAVYRSSEYLAPDLPDGTETVEVLSKTGSSGEETRQIQTALRALGLYGGEIDGIYGVVTADAVRRFQSSNGMTADGVAGPQTLAALGIYTYGGEGVYKTGSRGDMVRRIQTALRAVGYYAGETDGIFGPLTEGALINWQRDNGLAADGIAGSATLSVLGLSGGTPAPSDGGWSAEQELLARIISAEARGEPYIGQVAVGAVILNRVAHSSFPDTISGVIYQMGAFESVSNGEYSKAPADSAYRAARDALNGSDPTGGAIYFYNPAKTSNKWMLARPVLTVIASHRFCG